MSKRVAVVIAEDPTKTHRPVEALRIALGLCAGDHETTIILLGKAPLLLTDETDDVIDVDILEKYRPSFKQLACAVRRGITITDQICFSTDFP